MTIPITSRLRVLAAMLLVSIPGAGQQPAPSGKPPHRQVHTTCEQCALPERDVNAAFDFLDFWWDRKLALQASIASIEMQMAERESLIRSLELVPASSRSAAQQQSIDRYKAINAAEHARLARARGELQDVESQITAWTSQIKERLTILERCVREKCKTSPPTEPVNTIGGSGETALATLCEQCRPLAEEIGKLQRQKAELDQQEREFTSAVLLRGPLPAPLSHLDEIYDRLRTIDSDIEAAWIAYWRCLTACLRSKPLYTRPHVYGPVIGIGVLGGVLSTGGKPPRLTPPIAAPEQPSPPIGTTPNPAPQPPQTAPAPTPQTDCSQSSGRASMTGTVRAPANFRLPTGGAVVPSPQVANLTLDIHSDCTGTITITYSNGWVFAYSVRATVTGTTIQLVSTAPFTSSQMFGVATSSTIEFTVNGNTVTGIETHRAGSLTEIVDWQGTRQ